MTNLVAAKFAQNILCSRNGSPEGNSGRYADVQRLCSGGNFWQKGGAQSLYKKAEPQQKLEVPIKYYDKLGKHKYF